MVTAVTVAGRLAGKHKRVRIGESRCYWGMAMIGKIAVVMVFWMSASVLTGLLVGKMMRVGRSVPKPVPVARGHAKSPARRRAA